MEFDEVTASDAKCADAAVVRTLWAREAARRETVRPLGLWVEEGVFLLEAEPRLLVAVLVLSLASGCTRVGRDWGSVDMEGLAHHENVVATADWIRELSNWLEHNVALVAGCLVRAGAVVAPCAWLVAVSENFGLGPDLFGRLGAVDPDVFGSVNHPRNSLLWAPWPGLGHALRLTRRDPAALADMRVRPTVVARKRIRVTETVNAV